MINVMMDLNNLSFKSTSAESLKIKWNIPEHLLKTDTLNYLNSTSFIFANATWILRVYLRDHLGTFVSLIRLHSLVWHHEFICVFDVMNANGDGEPLNSEQEYCKVRYNGDILERKYYIKRASKHKVSVYDLPLPPLEKLCGPDGILVIMCHLLSEELADPDQHLQICHMDHSDMYKISEKENSGSISCKFSKAQFLKIRWNISDYSSLPETKDYSVSSPPFDFNFATWFLKWYPNGTTTDSDMVLSIVKSHSSISFHDIIYKFEYECGTPGFDHYKKFSFNGNGEVKDFDTFDFNKSELVEREIFSNGNATFLCLIFSEESTMEVAVERMLHELDICKAYSEDFKKLFLNGKDYDLILKVQDREFQVHRHILSARSQVFESMLAHELTEKSSGVVHIPDCDPQAMEQFLLYVYSGKVQSLNESNMLELYYIADKYNMVPLKQECCDFIQNSLSYRNICYVIQLATCHSEDDLLKSATDYFVKNSKEILSTSEWISFKESYGDIANGLLDKVSS